MKKRISLLLVLVFAGSASATLVGFWDFEPDGQPINKGAAAPLGNGPVGPIGLNLEILPGVGKDGSYGLVNTGPSSTGMNVGGGSDWTQVSAGNNYNALNLMIGDFSVEFDISRDDAYTGWNEPVSKYNVGAARSDWLMEMVGPTNDCQIIWKSCYSPTLVSPTIYYGGVDLTGGFHHIIGNRIVDAGGVKSELWIDGNLVSSTYLPGLVIAVNGGDIELGGNSKYPGDSGPAVYDNFGIHDEAIPEPATIGLLGLGVLGMIRRKRG